MDELRGEGRAGRRQRASRRPTGPALVYDGEGLAAPAPKTAPGVRLRRLHGDWSSAPLKSKPDRAYDYAQNLRPVQGVEVYGGRDLRRNTENGLGMVYANAEGADCDDAIAKAFASLLDQAKAMGGTRVVHAQTRNRHHWSGKLACRWGNNAETRGVAMP